MTIELLSPLIALAGILISILASGFVSSRQSKIEIKKLRTELQMAYANKLVDKRMETYPVLSKLISDFEKAFKYGMIQKPVVDKLFKQILLWDSSYAVFMSSHTIRKYVKFRNFIFSLKELPKKDFDDFFSNQETRKSAVHQIRELEIGLQQDLGVFVVDFPDVDKNIISYTEVSELVHKRKN